MEVRAPGVTWHVPGSLVKPFAIYEGEHRPGKSDERARHDEGGTPQRSAGGATTWFGGASTLLGRPAARSIASTTRSVLARLS